MIIITAQHKTKRDYSGRLEIRSFSLSVWEQYSDEYTEIGRRDSTTTYKATATYNPTAGGGCGCSKK